MIHYDQREKESEEGRGKRETRLRIVQIESGRIESSARAITRNHPGLVTGIFIACSYNEINQSSFRVRFLSLSLPEHISLGEPAREKESLTKFSQRLRPTKIKTETYDRRVE